MKRTVTQKNNRGKLVVGIIAAIIVILIIGYLVITNLSAYAGEDEMVNEKIVTISTSKGNIVVQLNEAEAPITVANFKQYVKEEFYNGTVFHRVIKDFMVQGGGFTPDGNQKKTSAPIVLEAGLSNDRGTIAMARTNDPNSATTQFFINHADNGFLNPSPGNPGYAVFGKVISGMDVVDEIAKVQTKDGDWPVENVMITSITFGGEINV